MKIVKKNSMHYFILNVKSNRNNNKKRIRNGKNPKHRRRKSRTKRKKNGENTKHRRKKSKKKRKKKRPKKRRKRKISHQKRRISNHWKLYATYIFSNKRLCKTYMKGIYKNEKMGLLEN